MKTINSFRSKLLALTLALMASVSTFAYKSQWCDTWNVFVENGSVYPPHEETYRYQLAQDTVIGEHTYTAVVSKAINDALDTPRYIAAVRFTDDRKVYIYYDNAEYLLYDFNVQEGDELEVFAGINNYTSEIKTYKCTVTGVEQYACIGCPATITLQVHNHPNDFREFYRQTQWIEGIGDINGFLNGINGYINIPGNAAEYLLCAYQGDELKYTGDLYEEYGCGDDAEQTPEDLFPTLWGLQRTHTIEMYDYAPNDGKRSGGYPLPFASVKDTVINGKTYLQFGDHVNGSNYSLFFLREENNKVLIYSSILQEDLVLYDYTLKLGDSLPAITSDHDYFSDDHFTKLDKAENIFTYVVTDVSTITLLDGIERKKWILKNKYLPIIEYVEGIGCYGENTSHSGDFFRLIHDHPYKTEYVGDHLVCVSKNGQLLYSMPQEEMNSFTLTCECLSQEDTIAPEDLFPTLWGLQRTGCTKTIGENGNGTTVWGSRSYLMQEIETATIDGKQYLLFGTNNIYDEYCSLWLREENNKILVYSTAQKKDLVLYDFTLNVGDSLSRLYVDYELSSVVDYDNDEWGLAPLVVTEVSTITLLDGKEYKKWTFDNGIEYVEGIGSFGSNYGHNDFYQLIANGPLYSDVHSQHLVCVSKNGQLLYKMDDAEMEQLETECLCEIEPKWSETWCNQWNILSHGYLGPQDPLAGARTSIYWLSNNTVNRNGQEYIPLMCSSSLPNEESTHLVGELRFTEDKQVYFYYAFDETEYLLYDFGAELGDTLELFAGLEFYNYHKTYTHVITDKETLDDGRLQIQADVVIRIDNGAGEYFEEKHPVTWIEGLGSTYGIIFNPSNPGVAGDGAIIMLCAYREDECVYTTNFSDYKNVGCVYNNDGTVDEDLFPMLAGLQRTVCNEFCGDTEDDNSSNTTYKQTFDKILFERDQPYIYCNSAFLLREENNKILIYSHSLDKDLVLYDFTLEVGDSLPQLYLDEEAKKDIYWIYYEYMNVVDYNKYNDSIYPADTLIVTDVSMITLLDGKEYKKWTFNNGMEYVEGIGMYGGRRGGNFFGLIQEVVVPCHIGTHLVCASKNGQLLDQMDDAEMERLGAECLCDVETSYKSQWCNKWNVMWFDGMRFDETASTSQYRLGKDTVIGDYTYSKFTSRTSVRFTNDRKVYVYYEGFDDNDPYTEDLPTGEYLAYDFSAQVGDTLEVFSGCHSYTTEQCVVYDVQTDPETNLRTIMLHPLCVVDGDGNVGVSDEEITWIEGVGSPNGFLISTPLPGGGLFTLLCAYKDDELKYTGSFYERFGCEYKAGVVSDDLFPTLSGLQRTICREYYEQADNKTRIEQYTNLTTRTETGGPYIYCSPFLLREEDNKILIYSRSLDKDLVLYDFNLQVGDSLPMLYIDFFAKDDWIADSDMEIWCIVDYHKDLEGNILPADTLIVTDVSAITLLDGKEYKKWTFNNGMEYVEGIGSFGNRQWSGDFFQLIANRDIPTSLQGEHLVCASRNGKLLYQMDDAEMERLGAECLCEAENPEDLFPTLWGLQRTSCDEWLEGCGENKSYLFAPKEVKEINGKLYLKCGGVFLREEDSKVLIYSFPYEKDFVLYDWTLGIGDTLQILGIDPFSFPELEYTAVVDYVAFEEYDANGNRTIVKKPLGNKRVKDISTMRLLDGNEYKAWLFGYDWERGNYYVEGIGNASKYGGDYVDLVCPFEVPSCYYGERLVCVSRDGVLLYQMDEEEMERLGAECLCDYTSGPKKDNAKDGQIGGRPTPTQWNMLEMELRKMENGVTILQAETFSYILEDISQQVNNKTYFQLTRQSTKDTATTKSVVGALHFGKDEDNRVYFLRDGVEYVLYDFTAEPGDTVEIFAGVNNYPQETTYTHVVTGKDTLENGACRMILEVVFPDETTTAENAEKVWLAGLGSIDGIVHNAASRASNARSSETQTSVMLCAWRDDDCLYTTDHPDYDTLGCVYNTESTGVGNTTSTTSYQKILRNGQLLILHQDRIYNVIGVEIK